MKRWIAALMLGLAATGAAAQDASLKIDITTDKQGHDGPLCVPLSLSFETAKLDEVAVDILTGRDAIRTVGQLTAPGITTESIKPAAGMVRRDLHVIVHAMPGGKTWTLAVHLKKT